MDVVLELKFHAVRRNGREGYTECLRPDTYKSAGAKDVGIPSSGCRRETGSRQE